MQNLILTSNINNKRHLSAAGSGAIFPRTGAGDVLIWVKEADLYKETSSGSSLPDSDLILGFRI